MALYSVCTVPLSVVHAAYEATCVVKYFVLPDYAPVCVWLTAWQKQGLKIPACCSLLSGKKQELASPLKSVSAYHNIRSPRAR